MRYIYEVPVYDGSSKKWRVLNINTGTVYSGEHDSKESAFASINNGEVRNEYTVFNLTLSLLLKLVNFAMLEVEMES